jgi:hypothetical protein
MDDFPGYSYAFSPAVPRIVESARSAPHAVREGIMAISNLLDMGSISDMPISTWSCSTLLAALPLPECHCAAVPAPETLFSP